MSNFNLLYENNGYHIHLETDDAASVLEDCMHLNIQQTQDNTNALAKIVGVLEGLIALNKQPTLPIHPLPKALH